jgi:hypothetical protein
MSQNPTEICTIARAQQLGIFNGEGKEYKADSNGNDYSDLRTYNLDVDSKENRTKTLCKDSLDGVSSSRNCIDQFGPGFIRKLENLDSSGYVCSAYDCPPGFTKTNGICQKPLADAEVDKRSHCDERWYDWFVTPNYHLGNGVYSSNVGQCYAPCTEYQVPGYATDPVDGTTLDFVSTENIEKCIPRDKYFYGKYKIGSDYCPIAWIHRLNATPISIGHELSQKYNDFATNNLTTSAFSTHANNPTSIKQSATYISQQCSAYYNNIEVPTENMQNACNTLNTPERVTQAYKWCAELFDNEEEYRERIKHESGDSEHIDRKVGMMKQACNAVFCNDNDTALGFVTENQICFPSPPNIDPATGHVILDDDKPDPEPPTTKNAQTFVKKCIVWFIYIIFVPAFLLILWFFYSKVIYPNIIKPIWLALERLLLGKDPIIQQLQEKALERVASLEHMKAVARLSKNKNK